MKNLISLALVLAVLGCVPKKKIEMPAEASASSNPTGTTIARLDGQAITDEDVRKVAGSDLIRAEMELYDARKAGLQQILEDRLLQKEAAKQGVSKDDYVRKNVSDKVKVTDADIQKFYNENKDRFGGKKFDEVKGMIRGYVAGQKNRDQMNKLIAGLKKKSDLEILISAPKMKIEEGDAPGIGPKDAPVRMVEWTDYQCPFCGRARDSVNRVLSEYKGKVRYVLKDFPLSFHKDAFKAHEGAHCAEDQGKYWEMNKKLFADQKAITIDDLKKYAGEIKLNLSKFNECLESGKHAQRVRQYQQEGQEVGVSGTPAFFINGRLISGARPFEDFKDIIDDELAN